MHRYSAHLSPEGLLSILVFRACQLGWGAVTASFQFALQTLVTFCRQ